ncbi:hypothetical protein GGR58DRAFT_461031 [Xylaria digitata]|nr:hypothetical protein GGR58DRAFT_461031 [Xylaria digitata]
MCGCKRTTYLCRCRHKERRIERCHIYHLREQGSCWAWCFPACRTTTHRYRLERVCRECDNYFHDKYGEEQYKEFIQLFLEYKESKGWEKTVIDPRSIPREVLLRYQAEGRARGQGSSSHGHQKARGQPFQAHQPMIAPTTPHIRQEERCPTPVANYSDRYPGPAVGIPRKPVPIRVERKGTPFPHNRTPSPDSESDRAVFVPKVSGASYIPNRDKPLPADPDLFAVGDDYEGEDEDEDVKRARGITTSPVPRYHNHKLPPGFTVVPELAHLALTQPRHRRSSSPPEMGRPALRHVDSLSDTSIVKRLTKAARDIEIPNIEPVKYNGEWVTRVITPPKGERRTRTPTPSPPPPGRDPIANWRPYSTQAIDSAIEANAVPKSLVPGGEAYDPSTYYVTTRPDTDSPTGVSARVRHSPSHENVAMPPPQRLDGVFIPSVSRDSFFKERGLPSETYVQQECKSATLAQQSPVLVSVRTPSRRYSAAVQACYCEDGNGEKCTSCRARDKQARELQMTWI